MISIIVPFLNESENLKLLLPCLLKKTGKDFELIFVNDGSTDDSEDVLFHFINSFKEKLNYRYINQPMTCGIGAAYKSAIKVASGSHICMLASDNEDNVEDIIKGSKFLSDYDVVMFYNHESKTTRANHRRLLSLIFRTYVGYRFGIKTLYFNAMGNLYPLKLLKSIEISSDGFFCLAEIVIKVSRLDCTIVHCPRELSARLHGRDKALTIRSVFGVVRDYYVIKF